MSVKNTSNSSVMLGGVDSNTFETNNFQGLQFIQIKGNDSFGDALGKILMVQIKVDYRTSV